MLFTKNQPFSLELCTTCQGAGYVGIWKCRKCRGMSLGRLKGDQFLFFGEPITKYHSRLRQAERWLNRFEVMGSMVFGLGFLAWFGYAVYVGQLEDALFTRFFWLESNSNVPLLFWLSIISWSYLLYRLIESYTPPVRLSAPGYRSDEGVIPPEEIMLTSASWETIHAMPRRKKINIARSFSEESRLVLEEAFRLAEKSRTDTIEPRHVFSALLSRPAIAMVFIRLGISAKVLQASLADGILPADVPRMPRLGDDGAQILFHAYDIAEAGGDRTVGLTALLLATVEQSEAIQDILYDRAIDKQTLANVIAWVRIRERLTEQYRTFRSAAAHVSKHGIDRAMTAVATPYLNSFSQDLTIAAKFGHLAPCVARDKEIGEVFRIIDGGRQSVILVGEHGVGKMSIIEGIVARMIEGDVPARLVEKRLVQLSASALLAGTTVSGAEERLIKMMHEIRRAKNVILFVHNIHDLVSVGSTAGGEGLDVAKTLAEYLSDGDIMLFATTTLEGYNRHIVNSELGSPLARVDVKEADENQAIQILESKVGGVEYKQNVFFSYAALAQCVSLAAKFLHDQRLPESALSLMTEAAAYARNKKGQNQLVTKDDVAVIIHEKTGIPVTTLTADESTKLLQLEAAMHERVVGQNEAVVVVASALRRARAEIRSTARPIANFLFLGPTGVGKTELAKTIAEVYFGGEAQMIRLDMSEFQDASAVYRLIGEPGKQGTGLLTEAVRQHPFSLVLLDELEKADPNILNLFLQVFDDGRLTDSVGRVIDFTNTIIIATSNAGTRYVAEEMARGTSLDAIRQALIRGELKQYFRPEFLNRFDSIVLFHALARNEIKRVAELMLRRVAKDLEKRGIDLKVEAAALDRLADAGFDPEFGARPMRRAIQSLVEDKLAELILSNQVQRRDTVIVGGDGTLQVKRP